MSRHLSADAPFTRRRSGAYALTVGEHTGTRAALLQALFAGPADSDALARRVARGHGRLTSGPPEVARALRELVRSGLLRRWPGRSGGRGAAYYELTSAGVAEAEALREASLGFATAPRSRGARAGSKTVDRRLKRSLDISAVAGALGRRGVGSTSRR